MATVNIAYAASVSLTVTNLHSLTSSGTFVAGWESAVIDNTTNKYVDVLLSGTLVTNTGANPTANTNGLIYVAAIRDDTPNYHDVLDGTESTETFTSVNVASGFLKLAAVVTFDAAQTRSHGFGPVSVAQLFGGIMPNKWSVVVTQNSGQTLNSANNAIYYTGVTYTVA